VTLVGATVFVTANNMRQRGDVIAGAVMHPQAIRGCTSAWATPSHRRNWKYIGPAAPKSASQCAD